MTLHFYLLWWTLTENPWNIETIFTRMRKTTLSGNCLFNFFSITFDILFILVFYYFICCTIYMLVICALMCTEYANHWNCTERWALFFYNIFPRCCFDGASKNCCQTCHSKIIHPICPGGLNSGEWEDHIIWFILIFSFCSLSYKHFGGRSIQMPRQINDPGFSL